MSPTSAADAPHPAIVAIQGRVDLLNQRLDSSVQAMMAASSALTGEVHALAAGQAELLGKMSELGQTARSVSLLTEAIRESNRLAEAKNEKNDRQFEELRDKASHARGERTGAGFVLVLLISLVGYIYVADKNVQVESNQAVAASVNANATTIANNKAGIAVLEERVKTLESRLGVKQ